jgi:hypothetical protein
MKITFKLKCILALGIGLSARATLGHDIPVHQAITFNAQESAYDISSAYVGSLNTVSSDIAFVDATNYIVHGSGFEDNADVDAGGKRSYNHFYDPLDTTYGKGLSDAPPDIRSQIGINSFTWGSVSNCPGWNWSGAFGLGGNLNTMNTRSWQNARYYEWIGLTATNQSDRFVALTNMFRDVGQVMHLLEDTTSPQHVRNEQHLVYLWESPIESWGLANVNKLNYQHTMLDWRGAGFTKLEDFWDRHLYNGSASALNNAEAPNGTQLGLAEWCNGNFLGARHLYAEYYQPSDIEYYPYPSRNTSTDYPQKVANLPSGIQTLTLKNGQQGQAIYVNKTGDGVTYPDISRFTYFGAKFPSFGMMTINDPNVLSNYHNVFIPKAVEYSAGLLDYFFRGKLNVCIVSGSDANTLGLFVQNKSGTNFYNGMFQLYSEDGAGTRTLILTTNLSDLFPGTASLADNASVTMDFTPPAVPATAYVAVYQGTIGATGSTPLDPVDENIAIAAKRIIPTYPDTNDPTPDRLEYPDPADLGEVTVDGASESTTNRVSFGSFGPAEYQVNYVDGAYGFDPGEFWTMQQCPSCTYPFGTAAWYVQYEDGLILHSAVFQGANYWDGGYTMDEVRAITLSNNPEADLFQRATGPISLKLGTGVVYYGDPGSVTYQLQRVASFYSEPTRVRIKNYATEVEPLLTVCTDCLDATSETVWDGSFNYRELFMPYGAVWYPDDTSDYKAINGKVADYIDVWYNQADSDGPARWVLQIWGPTSDYFDDELVWSGCKYTGTNPVGTYSRDPNTPMCADGLCCLYIESF